MLQNIKCLFVTALAVAVHFAQITDAANSMARHERLFVVPRPGPVVIDGKLDDWDLSGQLFIYVLEETSASQSARFAAMYDADAIYLSGVMRDPSPMMNRHDPKVEAEQAWDADACQFRMILDASQPYPATDTKRTEKQNDQLARATLWYFTDRQEANLLLAHGMKMTHLRAEELRGGVPHDRFEAKYVMANDNLGYTFEYRIPWTTLGARKPPTAGDLVAGCVQFNFSRPDGMKTAGRSAWAYDVMNQPGFPYKDARCWGKLIFSEKGNLPRELVEEGAPPEKPLPLTFACDLPEESEITIALFDDNNMLVRNIVVQGNRLAGRVVERWDGLDEIGNPIPPGTYAWRGLYHQPLKTKFVLSVHNSGTPPYKTNNNRGGWGGDHGVPMDISIVDDVVSLSWDNAESGWGIIRTDLNGKKRWGIRQCALYLAGDKTRIFSAGGGGFKPHNGVNVLAAKDAQPLNFSNGKPELVAPAGGTRATDAVTGLAYRNGTVFVAYAKRNLIGVFDADTGNLRSAWDVPTPGRLATTTDGRVLAVSAGRVCAIVDGKVTTFAETHLDVPVGVATDNAGNVCVTNRGKLQNVSVYDANGTYLRSIGKPGGRPARGAYDPTGMLDPAGIAVDKTGAAWVAEAIDSPKRVSVWDTTSGKLLREFFGGSAYATFLSMDPKRPDEVYCHNTLWTVDLENGTWYPKSTAWRQLTPLEIHETGTWGYNGHARVMTADNGQQFAWGMWNYAHVISIRDGDLFRPFAAAIRVWRKDQRWQHLYAPLKDNPKKYPDGAYLWQDTNNDQSVQVGEITAAPFANRAGGEIPQPLR